MSATDLAIVSSSLRDANCLSCGGRACLMSEMRSVLANKLCRIHANIKLAIDLLEAASDEIPGDSSL